MIVVYLIVGSLIFLRGGVAILSKGLILEGIKGCISLRMRFRYFFIEIDDGKFLFLADVQLID